MPEQRNSNEKRIEVLKNGPFLVKGGMPLIVEKIVTGEDGIPLKWEFVKEIEPGNDKQSYALCRCGESKNKPFCDNTHAKINFIANDVENFSYADYARIFKGISFDLGDMREICSGASFCHRESSIWNLINESGKEKIVREIAACCPSGRLKLFTKNGDEIEERYDKVISITQEPFRRVSGALWVKGGVPIISHKGFTYEIRNRVTLCRCGKSAIKPFCNGVHVFYGFNDGYF